MYRFRYDEPLYGNVTIPKGSIAVNGTSLTVVDSEPGEFSVAIIPYTYEHTNFHTFVPGTKVQPGVRRDQGSTPPVCWAK